MTTLSDKLSRLAPLQDPAHFRLGGLAPAAAAAPTNASSVAAALSLLAEEGAACVPWGGGVRQEMGFLPRRYDAAVSTVNLTRLVDLQPGDLTVTVEAGMALGQLQSLLAEHGQFVALESPHPERETIGGLLATGASALLRYAYGPPRDQVIGMAAAMPDGSVVRVGGRVVKNVAGYDLCKLFTGSMGTLGIIVEATFRVRPLPPSSRTWIGFFPSPAAVEDAIAAVMDSALQPTFIQVADQFALKALPIRLPSGGSEPAWGLILGADGHEQLSVWTAEEADRLAHPLCSVVLSGPESAALRQELVRRCGPGEDPSTLCIQVSVLPSETMELMQTCQDHVREGRDWSLSSAAAAGTGVIYFNFSPLSFDLESGARSDVLISPVQELSSWLDEKVAATGGSCIVLQCPRSECGSIGMWGRPTTTRSLMRRIRQQFDPHLVLNRGRLFEDEQEPSAV